MTDPKARHGGARPGAGRPRTKPRANVLPGDITDPLVFLLAVMSDETQSLTKRVRAAVALLPYSHAKPATASPAPSDAKPRPSVVAKFRAQPTPIRPH